MRFLPKSKEYAEKKNVMFDGDVLEQLENARKQIETLLGTVGQLEKEVTESKMNDSERATKGVTIVTEDDQIKVNDLQGVQRSITQD